MVSEPSSDQHHPSAAMVSDKQRFAKIETSIAQLSEALQTMSLQLGRRLNGDTNGGERRNRRRRDDGQTEWGTGHVKSTIRRRNWSDNGERTGHNRREDRRSGEGGSRRHPKHVRGDNIRVRENPLYDESEESDASLQNEWNESLKDTRLKMGESSSAGLFARSGSLFDQHIKWVEGEYDGPPKYDEAEGEARDEEASFEEEQPRYDVETDFEEAGCRIVIEFMSWGKESQETQPFASEFDGKLEEEESTDGESVTAEIESQHEEFPTLEVLQAGVDVHVVVAEEHEQEVVAEIGTDLIPNKLTEWSLNSFVKKEGVFESGSFKESLQDSVEWFNVFKSSKLKAVEKANDNNEDKLLLGKKEYHQQMERDALFQKKHKVHVSGSNIPSPLQSFVELRSRHNCRSYLVHNLAELGFKEPTPIQRQAIPVLLSGRECFACAPTGSGKTFAFVCPILVKLGHASKDGTQAVILCPTRELAAQTARECKKLCKGKKFYIKFMTKQQRWIAKLVGFNDKIIYRSKTENNTSTSCVHGSPSTNLEDKVLFEGRGIVETLTLPCRDFRKVYQRRKKNEGN